MSGSRRRTVADPPKPAVTGAAGAAGAWIRTDARCRRNPRAGAGDPAVVRGIGEEVAAGRPALFSDVGVPWAERTG
ncbi:hypothetical protein ACWEVP_33390 [Amycolatopsis sp. NPDC003865]